jgi:hypothetical protein
VIDFTDPQTAHQRLSNSERESAVNALTEYAAEGRLTHVEATERAEVARKAVTRGDLASLFADLPVETASPSQPTAAPDQPTAANFGPGTYQTPPQYQNPPIPPQNPGNGYGPGYWWGGGWGRPGNRTGWAITAIMPFIALVLFFVTGAVFGYQFSWLWFLLVPAAGAISYAIGGGNHRNDPPQQ